MKDLRKNTLDRLGESGQAEEYYSYTPKDASLADEHFIFQHDQNNEIFARNYTGEEVNKKFQKLKEHREESFSVEKVQEVTTTTGATNAAVASSTVSTAVAATTTAVIAVVGGGMVVQSVTYEAPKVSIAEVVGVTQDSISFKLGLVNSKDEENGYCDCVIDLKCLSYNEKQEVDVGELGTSNYEFSGLRPGTDYTLEIYSKSFLDLERKKLDSYEPITVTTLSAAPTRSIEIKKQYDPFEDTMFFVEFNNVETSPSYVSYILEAYYPENHQASYGGHKYNKYDRDSLVDSVWLEDGPTVGQYVSLLNLDPEETYDFRLVAYLDPTSGGGDGSSEPETEVDPIVVLAEETINLSLIETSPFEIMDKTFFKRDGLDESMFQIYCGLTNTEGRSDYTLNFYEIIDQVESIQPILEVALEDVNIIYNDVILDLVELYTTYKVTLTCRTTNPTDIEKYIADHPEEVFTSTVEEIYDFEIRTEMIDLNATHRGEEYDRMYYASIITYTFGFEHKVYVQTEASSYDAWESYELALRDPTYDETVSTNIIKDGENSFICEDSETIYQFLEEYKYNSSVLTISASLVSTGENVTIYKNEYFDNNINPIVEDKLYFQRVAVSGGTLEEPVIKYFGFIGCGDTYQLDDFVLKIYTINEDGQQGEYLTYQNAKQGEDNAGTGANVIFPCDDDVCDYFNDNQQLFIEVICLSNRPEDIETYNQEHMGSEVTEGPVEITLREEFVDTSTFYQAEEDAPEITNVDLEIRQSHYNEFVYVTVSANNFKYWEDLNISLADSDEYQVTAYGYMDLQETNDGQRVYRCSGDDGELAAFLHDFNDTSFILNITAMDRLVAHESVTIYEDRNYVWKGSVFEGGINGAILFERTTGSIAYNYVEIAGASELLDKYYYFQIVFLRQSDGAEFIEQNIDVTLTNVHIGCMDEQTDIFTVRLEGLPYYGDGEYQLIFEEVVNFDSL